MSPNLTPEGQDEFIKSVIATRRTEDPDIYDKIIVADNRYSRFLIGFATVLLIILFLYAYYDKEHGNSEIMVYGSIVVIGSLLASGLAL